MQKILWISDHPGTDGGFTSGMGRVTREFCKRLNRDFQVIVGGWHYQGEPLPYDFPVVRVEKGVDQNAYNSLKNVIVRVQPEMIVLFGDYFYFPFTPALKQEFPNIKLVGYINVDSEPLLYNMVPSLKCFDKIICSTYWGMELISELDPTLKPRCVYHGMDFDVFKPLDDCVFQGIPKKHNQFIVVNNQQNTMRHNVITAIEAFCKFADGKKDAKMIANTDPNDPCGYRLGEILKYLPSPQNVILPRDKNMLMGMKDEELNKLYNIGTCMLSTTTAEGVGFSVLESFATKLPVLATKYSSIKELLADGRGTLLNTNNRLWGQHTGQMMMVDINDTVQKLETTYNLWKKKPEKFKHLADKAYEWIQQYSWDSVYSDMYKEIIEVFNTESKHIVHPNIVIDIQLRESTKELLETRSNNKQKIGIMVLGGIGDNLMVTPLAKGIKKRYPESHLTIFVINGTEVFKDNPDIDVIAEIGNKERNQAMKSVYDLFDVFYDVRGVTRVFGEEESEFYNKYKWFYEFTNASYHNFDMVGEHFIDMILKSARYDNLVTKDDINIKTENYPYIPKQNYVVISNAAGVIGQMKCMAHENAEALVKKIRESGVWCVQTGTKDEKYINGAVDMRGMLSIPQLAYVLKNAKAFVGIEGGVAHIAKAVGTKGIIYFGNSLECTYGYPENINLSTRECRPCYWRAFGEWHDKCVFGYKQCKNIPSVDIIAGAVVRTINGEEVKELDAPKWVTTRNADDANCRVAV